MSRHLDRWVEPLLLVTIAVGIFVDSLSYPPTVVPGAPGPTFFPRLLALILVGCAGFLTWRPPGTARRPHEEPELSALEPEQASSAAPSPLGEPEWTGGSARLVGAIVSIGGFLLLAARLDTYGLLPLLVGGLMAIMGERRARALVGIPILFTLFVYLVFFRALGVALPTRLL